MIHYRDIQRNDKETLLSLVEKFAPNFKTDPHSFQETFDKLYPDEQVNLVVAVHESTLNCLIPHR